MPQPLYDEARLYGAPRRFAGRRRGWLRNLLPHVLRLDESMQLQLPFGRFRVPRGRLHKHCRAYSFTPRAYNPSIATAPPGLCPGCALVAVVRADALHQCDASGATRTGFQATAIMVLNATLHSLGWGWLYNNPSAQLTAQLPAGRWTSGEGIGNTTGNLPPPLHGWRDVRLLNVRGSLLVTAQCRQSHNRPCPAFTVSQLHLSAVRSSDGLRQGLEAYKYSLRAWIDGTGVWPSEWVQRGKDVKKPWVLGCNQALFAHGTRSGTQVIVQPWLHLIATMGTPAFSAVRARNPFGSVETLQLVNNTAWYEAFAEAGQLKLSFRRGWKKAPSRWFGPTTLLYNHSVLVENMSAALQGRARMSTTANLVRIARDVPGGRRCEAYLGVGHLHRGASAENDVGWFRATSGHGERPNATFRWAHRYTHFFYTLQPRAPFRLLGTSGEWCIQSRQNPHDCESVQFVSGLAPGPRPSELVVSFGVNDCEAKVAVLDLARVWALLLPFTEDTASCETLRPHES